MNHPASGIVSPLLRLLTALFIVATGIWGMFALWYQAQGPLAARIAGIALWLGAGALALRSLRTRRRIVVGYMIVFALLLGWWSMLKPSHDRIWADDVAQLLRGHIQGDIVTLENVRNFAWRSETDYTPRWETREYDLSKLESADLILSYWMGPAIAHTLVSFGFSDGRRIVFSLEIRKERHESFSAIAGFFRQYETIIVASDERDIVLTRTNARGEDVYLYRLDLPPEALRTAFLAYVDQANQLARTPDFYNTLTSNCTTIVFDLARLLDPGLPLDYRLLASGYFAEYAYDHKGLAPGIPFETLHARGRITQRALAAGDTPEFPRRIREGVPGIDTSPVPARSEQ
ncbi:Lnb N-terminal periplasmic domain-containing protein [Paracandidimonas soli]|uniref:Lnb N-terminal periplasmic domain-containing protein n=1 Tax=Paracandidimonas soli TaxID=1917182 RepID=UPI003DA7173C